MCYMCWLNSDTVPRGEDEVRLAGHRFEHLSRPHLWDVTYRIRVLVPGKEQSVQLRDVRSYYSRRRLLTSQFQLTTPVESGGKWSLIGATIRRMFECVSTSCEHYAMPTFKLKTISLIVLLLLLSYLDFNNT